MNHRSDLQQDELTAPPFPFHVVAIAIAAGSFAVSVAWCAANFH